METTQRHVLATVFQVLCSEDDFYVPNSFYLLQSTICLVQAVGVNLGYIFKFGANGPVSEMLTEHLKKYLVDRKDIDIAVKNTILKSEVEAKLEAVKALMKPPKTAEGVKYLWLKILSLMYLFGWSQLNEYFQLSKGNEVKLATANYCHFSGYAFLDEAWERLEEFFGKK